jgi:hypothetical protein
MCIESVCGKELTKVDGMSVAGSMTVASGMIVDSAGCIHDVRLLRWST